MEIGRHTWTNTIVGMLDEAFRLTPEELLAVTGIVMHALDLLDIPGRGEPVHVPAAVALEAEGGHFSTPLHAGRTAGVALPALPGHGDRVAVGLGAWRQTIVDMIGGAYQLQPMELVELTTIIDRMLLSLGLPERAASWHPEAVLRTYWAQND